MNGSLVAGTVTARVTLDTSEFKSAVQSAKETLSGLKTAMNGLGKSNVGKNIQITFKHIKDASKSANQAKSDIDKLHKSVQNLNNVNLNTYKKNMREINQEAAKQKPLTKQFKTLSQRMDEQSQSARRYADSLKKLEVQRNRVYNNNQSNNLNTYKANMTQVNTELQNQLKKIKQTTTEWKNYRNSMKFNYSQYVSQITTINNALDAQRNHITKLASAQHRLYAKENTININTYKANISKVNQELRTQLDRTNRLASAQHRLYGKYNTTNLNTYKSNMNQINDKLKQQVSTQNKSTKATQNMGTAMGKVNTKTNYVNKNLWKLRGVILGIRTIFLSFGGIYIWQFAEEMMAATKETLKAKNEMEQFLKMNEKLGKHRGGIDAFNRGLDNTVKKFKKLNKYVLGETVASIGKEFNLSAREMEKSMDVVAMVQSEYVRAGRTEAEAALAVKDILQGEFMRLSRETGVGEKDLKALGWSGDNKDIMGLMDAIKKAGTDRHWDDFAKKATSLSDVFNILKNRFAEFGADLADAVTPMIVGAFNTMADAFDWLKDKFNGLSTGMKLGIDFGAIIGGFAGLTTVILKLWKGFGLMDVASVGLGKSLISAFTGLDIVDVRSQGLLKSLTRLITKTNVDTEANYNVAKSLGAWVLGVDDVVAQKHGLLTAMAQHTYALKNNNKQLDLAKTKSLKWYQKLMIAKEGMDVSTASSYGFGKSIRKLVFNMGMLRKAVGVLTLVTTIKAFADLAMYMDKAKKNIEGFYKVVDDGKNLTKEATNEYKLQKNRVKDLNKQIEEYKKQRKDTTILEQKYNQAVANRNQAKLNKEDIKTATERAKIAQKQLNEMMSSINLSHQSSLAKIYEKIYKDAGISSQEAQIKASKYNKTVTEGFRQQTFAYDKYNKRLESGVKHMQEHVGFLQQTGADTKEISKYAEDYDMVLQETSKHWKKFWEGDLWSGASAILGELKLAFVDLSYNPHFITLTKELTKTWDSWQPTLRKVRDTLGDLLNKLMDVTSAFLSTDIGKTTALWGGLGVIIGGVAIKVGKFVTGSKNVIEFFSKLGSKLKDVLPKLKRYGDLSKNTPTPTTGDIPTTTPTTVPTGKGDFKFWETVKTDAKKIGRNIAKAGMYIAGAMALATEAILLIQAPMGALADTGRKFKNIEPQVRSGIEGLKLIAPVMAVILPPVVALMVVMEKFGESINPSSAAKAFGYSAAAIAGSLILVAEAIYMLSVPLEAIAGLGSVRSSLGEGNIQQGLDSIQLVGESLKLLVPFIPVFALGVGLVALAMSTAGVGTVVTVSVVAGIALGMGILAESIASLAIPLRAIEALGSMQVNMEGVRKGAEIIRVTGEALKSVASAVGSMGDIIWDDIKIKVGEFISGSSVIEEITKEGGLIDKIVDFNTKFNTKMGEFKPLNVDLVPNLVSSADGIKQVQGAINKITEAMNAMSGFTQNEAMTMTTPLGAMMVGVKKAIEPSATDSGGLSDYLTGVEKIIDEVSKFNNRLANKAKGFQAPPKGLIGQLQQSATFISQVKGVVNKLQGTMQSALGTQVAAGASNALSVASNPIGALYDYATGQSSGGGYKSSIGGALQSMEDVIDDLVTFNSHINGKNIGEAANVDGLLNFVKAVQTAIKNVQDTLNGSKPVLEGNANALAQSITTGFNKGIDGLKNIKVVDLILVPINQTKSKLFSTMSQMGTDTRTNFTSKISGISDATKAEMGQIGAEIDSGKTANGSKAYGLGQYLVNQFKSGAGIHSPGYMARAMVGEVSNIASAIDNGITTLPVHVQHLATAMVNQFDPAFNTDFLNFTQNTEGLNTFNHSMEEVQQTSQDTLTSTNTTFTNMQNTINTTFDNIATNTLTRYNQLKTTTKTSLNNMQNQTTKNIGAIKSSWKEMQNALIASAEAIRSQTSEKINRLQTNMANFWKKIKNPGLLVSGSPTIRSPRRPTRSVGVKRSIGSTLRRGGGGFAGSPSSSRGSAGSNDVIKTPFTKKSSAKGFAMKELLDEYITLLFNGEIPYAGAWSFDWNDAIQSALMNWKPEFPKYKSLNSILSVADFDKSDFPVKGNAKFAKEYIKDAIEQTHYVYYYNSRHGNNPRAIWNAGGFNCWDGHILVMALASALGFPGGRTMHGMWGKDRHVWARIPGLGDIDSTAIQKGYGFTRGSRAAGMPHPAPHGKDDFGTNNTYNIEVTVHVEGNADKRVMEEAGEVAGRKIIDLLKPSMATGR